jgi:hypothetical protein
MQAPGWWHYEATRMVYGDAMFYSSTREEPLPRLLVLDPSIQLNAASQAEMKGLHLGLIVAGHISNRTWVWPAANCSSMRFIQSTAEEHWMRVHDPEVLFFGGPDNLRCIDLTFTWNYCMEVCNASPPNTLQHSRLLHCTKLPTWLLQKGMSLPDFEYYRAFAPDLTMQHANNTLHIAGPMVKATSAPADDRISADSGTSAEDSTSASDSTLATSVDLHNLHHMLQRMNEHHVIYITAPFVVSEGSTVGWHPGTCVPNCDYASTSPDLPKSLKRFESKEGCYPFAGALLPPVQPFLESNKL